MLNDSDIVSITFFVALILTIFIFIVIKKFHLKENIIIDKTDVILGNNVSSSLEDTLLQQNNITDYTTVPDTSTQSSTDYTMESNEFDAI